jgi:hypothetical protein
LTEFCKHRVKPKDCETCGYETEMRRVRARIAEIGEDAYYAERFAALCSSADEPPTSRRAGTG